MSDTVHSSAPLSLKVYSLNAKGLNVPEKHSSVLAEAHRRRAQTVFLQETHFKQGFIPCLFNGRFPEVYHAPCADSKTILMAKSFMFHLISQMLDPNAEGRFLFLKGTWKDRPVTLANICCPNSKRVPFIKDILLKLTSFQSGL